MPKVNIIKISAPAGTGKLTEDLERLLGPLGGMAAFVRPGDKVLLKPNVGEIVPADSPAITSVHVTEAAAQLAHKAGAAEVWIAESCIIGGSTEEAFKTSGYTEMAERAGIRLIDLKQEGCLSVTVTNHLQLEQIDIFERTLEADVIINLPKLKTIVATTMSVAMKNLKGLIPDNEKKRCHHTNLSRAIVDICQVIKPSLTIVDGIVGCGLNEAIPHNILIAGDNMVAVDAVSARCMGIEPGQVKYLSLASKTGLGPLSPDEITLTGMRPDEVMLNYPVAMGDLDGYIKLYPRIQIASGKACSGCVNMIDYLIKKAKAQGVYEKWEDKLVLAIGPEAPLDYPGKTVLCLGNCLEERHEGNYISGCTFMGTEAVRWLKEHDPDL